MSLSSITISGTLKKDPEKRLTPTNIPITNLLLEVTYMPRGVQKEGLKTQLIRINAWRDLGLQCEQKFKAGDKVLVIGRLQINAYVNQEGKKVREAEIDATSVTGLNEVMTGISLSQGQWQSQDQKPQEDSFKFETTEKNIEQISTIDDLMTTEEIPF